MPRRLFLTLLVLFFLVVGLLPLLSMLAKSLTVNGHPSLEAYRELLASSRQWILMGHSTVLASLVTLFSVGVGVPLGLLLDKTDLPLARFFTLLFLLPLLIPPYIMAVSWADLLGKGGLLASLLGPRVTEVTSRLLFGLPGCVWVLFSTFLPIPMLLTVAFLRTVDPHLEEAGRLVSGWPWVLRRITLPLVMPGVLLSAMLVFILTLGEFGVPSFLRYPVYSVESFTQFSAFYNFQSATASALPLAAVTLLLIGAETLFLRDRTYQLRLTPQDHLSLIGLGDHRPRLFSLVAAGGLITVVVPLAVLAFQAGGPEIYTQALALAWDSLLRSLGYAAVGATLLTFLGFFLGYVIQRRVMGIWRTLDSITLFLFALPSTVIGMGLISLWNRPWTNLIYGTPIIIVLGYLAKYTALTSRISVTQLAQIPPSMEEAAQMAGMGWFSRMAFIVAPLARRGLLAGWLAGYIFSLRDTGITMLVYPPGHETLPIRILTLMANGSPRLIAALCMVMITVTILPAGLLWVMPGIPGKGKAP